MIQVAEPATFGRIKKRINGFGVPHFNSFSLQARWRGRIGYVAGEDPPLNRVGQCPLQYPAKLNDPCVTEAALQHRDEHSLYMLCREALERYAPDGWSNLPDDIALVAVLSL